MFDVAGKHQVRSHFYADDSQMCDSCSLSTTRHLWRARSTFRLCDRRVRRVGLTSRPRRLQLNVTKTEAVWFGTRSNLDRLHHLDRHVQIDSEIISPVTVVRDLGVYLDVHEAACE